MDRPGSRTSIRRKLVDEHQSDQHRLRVQNQLSWFSGNNKHRLKLTSELRRDGYDQDQTTNLLGTFGFNSLADLAGRTAGVVHAPAARRACRAPAQSSAASRSAIRTGGASDLQIQYGVRLDANRFNSTSRTFNPQVEQRFRRAQRPRAEHAVPQPARRLLVDATAPRREIAGVRRAPCAARARWCAAASACSRTRPTPTLIGGAIDNTGLPSALQQLHLRRVRRRRCPTGRRTPNDPARSRRSAPTARSAPCSRARSPNVTCFAKDYAAPRSLRSNLKWSGPDPQQPVHAPQIEATYSLNMNQASNVDLNFSPTQQFTLADEGGRPVYVQPTSIVPATGAIASRDARVSPAVLRA